MATLNKVMLIGRLTDNPEPPRSLPSGGTVDTQVALPDAVALVGATFHHYVVPFEVDLALSVTAITNSNALTCTIGAF